MKILNPKSSESIIPLIVINKKLRFNFFLQLTKPFGLFLGLPFIFLRWGSA